MKAIDLVRKVGELTEALRSRRARETGTLAKSAARATELPSQFARIAAVRALEATTSLARHLQQLPMPTPRPVERLGLSLAAAQLRALVGDSLVVDAAASDPGSPEAALATLVHETLALVDRALGQNAEFDHGATRQLRDDEAAPHHERAKPSVVIDDGAGGGEGPPVTKISF